MSQESLTPPFQQNGRGTASSSPFLQSKENVHGREVIEDDKEEQPEKFEEQSGEQEASKELETEEEEEAIKDSGYATSPDVVLGHSARSFGSLKPKALTIKDFASPQVSATPKKRLFNNSSDQDDSERMKMMKEKVLCDDNDGNSSNEIAKPLFQRYSSDKDDEFAILKSFLDYCSENDTYPFVNTNALHDFVKNSLLSNVSVSHLKGKIEEFRKKNEKIVGEKGKNPNFSDPCDQEAFEYSKKIWGARSGTDDQNKLNDKENPFSKESLQITNNMKASLLVLEESIVKWGLALMRSYEMGELDEKLRKLQVGEIKIYLNRVDSIQEQMKLLLDAVKSSLSLH